MGENHIGSRGNHLFRQAPRLIQITFCEANIEPGIAAIQPIQPFERLFERDRSACISGSFSRPLISTPISRLRPDCCASAVNGHAVVE
jgi:hypothetical protein